MGLIHLGRVQGAKAEAAGTPQALTPISVFDELDSGVGGQLGGLVGKLLHELCGARHQVRTQSDAERDSNHRTSTGGTVLAKDGTRKLLEFGDVVTQAGRDSRVPSGISAVFVSTV
jgi:hypothetical protein